VSSVEGKFAYRGGAGFVHQRADGYAFPGNVRELKNIIERGLIESGGETIGPEHLKLSSPVYALGSQIEQGFGAASGSSQGASRVLASPRLPLIRSVDAALVSTGSGGASEAESLPLKLDEAEGLLIQRALAETGGNVAEAARRLGINRTRIYRRLAGRE